MDRTPGQKISKEITDLNIIDQRGASLVAQLVKNPPTIQETSCNAGDPGSSLGQEDPLEKKMTTHSSILPLEIPWTEDPGRLQSMGSKESDIATKPTNQTDQVSLTDIHRTFHPMAEGNTLFSSTHFSTDHI